MQQKKIIFIGGTSRSGSTLLDRIISNDPKAMSLGEINALFYPSKKKHFEKIEELKKVEKWSQIITDGKKNLYSNLINKFNNIDYFVDSSKNVFWIDYHIKKNNYQCDIKNILIFKSPEELAQSFLKRGLKNWDRRYIAYYKIYNSIIKEYKSISYKVLVLNPSSIKNLCEYLEIDYFEDKKNYWRSEQNPFFGSDTTKVKKGPEKLTQEQLSKIKSRKDISYDAPENKIIESVNKIKKRKPEIDWVYKSLLFDNMNEKRIKYNPVYIFAIRIVYEVRFIMRFTYKKLKMNNRFIIY